MMLGLVQQRLDPRLYETPRARIQRLLLAPHNRLCILVRVQVITQLRPRERVELLDARNGDVGDFVIRHVFSQGDVDLAGTQNDALDVGGFGDGFAVFWVGDDPLEVRIAGECFDRGAG